MCTSSGVTHRGTAFGRSRGWMHRALPEKPVRLRIGVVTCAHPYPSTIPHRPVAEASESPVARLVPAPWSSTPLDHHARRPGPSCALSSSPPRPSWMEQTRGAPFPVRLWSAPSMTDVDDRDGGLLPFALFPGRPRPFRVHRFSTQHVPGFMGSPAGARPMGCFLSPVPSDRARPHPLMNGQMFLGSYLYPPPPPSSRRRCPAAIVLHSRAQRRAEPSHDVNPGTEALSGGCGRVLSGYVPFPDRDRGPDARCRDVTASRLMHRRTEAPGRDASDPRTRTFDQANDPPMNRRTAERGGERVNPLQCCCGDGGG